MKEIKFVNKSTLEGKYPVSTKVITWIIYGFFGILGLAGVTWALGLFLKALKWVLIFVGVM